VIVGLGIELIDVPRFGRALDRFGERMRVRIFTDGEQAYAARRIRGGQSLAVRFAAKVAARRALGCGPGERRSGWRDIEVVREPGRAPTLRFHGAAARRAGALGVGRVALTLTHDRSTCLAQVVLEEGR
jgi:holo-[acyl-carrier protein] synthase